MKVLHVMNSAAGGAAMSTVALMTGLRKAGIASAAVCHAVGSREERTAIVDATEGRTTFTVLHSWNSKFRTPWRQRPVKALKLGLRTGWTHRSSRVVAAQAGRFGADLIHTNTILNPEGGMAARRLGLPHVWHLRERLGPGAWFRLPLEGPALGAHLARRCSRLVANSATAAESVRHGLPEGLLAIVPNGIDLSRFDNSRAANDGRIVVGMVGNLGSHVKKHALFIEAAALVTRDLQVRFRIFGAGPTARGATQPYVADLHARVRAHGLEERLQFAGFYSDPAMIMREIDVLVHPSDLESFGRIAVEAMAASRPVVGVRGGGVAEIVQDGITGVLAEPDNPSDLAAHIDRLVRDPSLRGAMGTAGRLRAEAHYSLGTHVARMIDVYMESLERPLQ